MSLFFFVLDISGSMYGQKIAAVNAALTEGMDVLRGLDEKEHMYASLAVFHEQMELLQPAKKVREQRFPYVTVEAGAEGFYPTTSYACLCRGLWELMKNGMSWDYLFLITDGKPADEGEYTKEMEQLKILEGYRNACTYVVLTGEDSWNLERDLLRLADDRADRVIRLLDLSSELSRIGMTFYQQTENAEACARVAEIFGS